MWKQFNFYSKKCEFSGKLRDKIPFGKGKMTCKSGNNFQEFTAEYKQNGI